MSDQETPTADTTLPVTPSMHVETFPSHYTATWKATSLAEAISAIKSDRAISSTAPVIVDETTTAGRQQQLVGEITASDTLRYLRVDPESPWTLSLEQRTWPVVSVSGAPPPTFCQRIHIRTTTCTDWPAAAVTGLSQLTTEY